MLVYESMNQHVFLDDVGEFWGCISKMNEGIGGSKKNF